MPKFADFILRRRGRASIWIDPTLAIDSVIDKIADPDRLLQQSDCEIIKDQLKIKVGCVPMRLKNRQLRVYVKRYNAFSWRYRMGSVFAQSGAFRALSGAQVLAEAGVATARPIAAVEERQWRLLTRSFYLTEEIQESKISIRFWVEELAAIPGATGMRRRRAFLMVLSQLFARLHRENIYHNDLKDFNILVAPRNAGDQLELFLLDLEGVRRCGALSRRRRIKNLVQINRTLGKCLSRTQRARFLKSYLENLGSAAGQRKTWARDIEQASRALDRQKLSV